MEIVITASAYRHGITWREIHAAVQYPQFSYLIDPRFDPEALVYMLIAAETPNAATVEVVAELVDNGTRWIVFHAMYLRPNTEKKMRSLFGDTVQFNPVRTQRPTITPRKD